MHGERNWIAPAMGIAFAAVIVLAVILTGEGPDPTEESADEVVAFYQDNEGEQTVGSLLIGLGGVLFLFFAGWVRRMLRVAEGEGGMLSAVAFGGAIAFATGIGVVATLNLALADLSDDLDPIAVQAINGIVWDYYIPFMVGMCTFLLATGIAGVRSGALPTWFAWVAIVLGVVIFTPIGFFAFLAGLIWILVLSVMGVVAARRGASAPADRAP